MADANVYRVGVIGTGSIVSGYDNPDDVDILTHCHALRKSPRFRLVGGFDSSRTALAEASRKWEFDPFGTFDHFVASRPDIVVVAVPDGAHEAYLDALVTLRPKLVVCEKPLTPTLECSTRIARQYETAGVPLAIGYQRRYDRDLIQLRSRYRAGELGALISGCVLYSKGVLHNGSHAIDLLRFLFGEVQETHAHRSIVDFNPSDPTVSGWLRFDEGDVALVAGDERLFSLFEIDLIFRRGRYRFVDSGMTVEEAVVSPDPLFPGYRSLIPKPARKSTLSTALADMWEAFAQFLDHGGSLACPASDAVKTQAICDALVRQLSLPS